MTWFMTPEQLDGRYKRLHFRITYVSRRRSSGRIAIAKPSSWITAALPTPAIDDRTS
jgi:hypothetical protein